MTDEKNNTYININHFIPNNFYTIYKYLDKNY